jgi:uracil-DNA glycosylase family 4
VKVLTEGPPDAKIMIVGESPGKAEDESGKPFQGLSGQTLNNLLGQAGIARYQCLVTNVAKERPPANKISFFFEDKKCTIPKLKLVEWITELKNEIELYRPNVIIALGSVALWALTGEKKISDFRGYILPCKLVTGVKVLPTYHPQAVVYEWKLYFQTVLDLRKALRHSESPKIPESKQLLFPNVNVRQFIEYMEMLIEHPEYDKLSVDVETIQPGSHIEELGLSHHPDFGMSIFILKGRSPALPENDELILWQTFARLVSCKKIIMQNGAYDTGVLWHNNHILIENIWMDTLIAAHICWPELPRDLGFLGSVCLDVKPWKGSSKTQEYNPADAANTFGIAEVLLNEIERQGSFKQFQFEMNLIPVSLLLQLQGITVDRAKQKELIEKWSKIRDDLKIQLDMKLKREVNFNSPKQMQQLLYIELGLPVQYKRRKSINEPRTMTTDANALRTLARLVPNNPVFNLIIEYKKANLLVRQFLDIELSPEGKVHTSYNITGASSDDEEDTKKTKRSFGRWSSSTSIILPYGSGNLQNIPPEARKMYRAPAGWKIIQADYAQAEAVVVAHLTGDQKLVKMFYDSFGLSKSEKKLYDIHKMTIATMLGIDVSEVTSEQRTVGKTIRHSTNYSAGPQVLANRLGIKMGEAKQLMELYHKANPNLRMWYQQIQEELKRSRTLTNLFGRKHRFLDRWGDSLFRSAYSYIPQSTIGDLLNKALLRIYDALPMLSFDLQILLQLHDAVYTMVKEENVLETIKFLRKCMLIPLEYSNQNFMIDIDFKSGDSWGEQEDIEINWREQCQTQ